MTDSTKPSLRAAEVFNLAIRDSENLLAHFDTLNAHPPKPEAEVLKRAGLIMAMTAWETYVEDRVTEAANLRLAALTDETIRSFVSSRLKDDISKLHNPTSEKTLRLFKDYAGIDLEQFWAWNHYDPAKVKEDLDAYLKLRGNIVHRARVVEPGPPAEQPVTKQRLQKAISFLKALVRATEAALAQEAV